MIPKCVHLNHSIRENILGFSLADFQLSESYEPMRNQETEHSFGISEQNIGWWLWIIFQNFPVLQATRMVKDVFWCTCSESYFGCYLGLNFSGSQFEMQKSQISCFHHWISSLSLSLNTWHYVLEALVGVQVKVTPRHDLINM